MSGGAQSRQRIRQTWRSLRNRNFRLYFSAYIISQTGNWVQITALTIYVVQLTNDGFAIGLINAARFAPALILSPWAGVLSDRRDRWTLVMLAQLGGLSVSILLTVAALLDNPPLVFIYGLAFAAGTAQALEGPARKALISDILQGRDVSSGISLSMATITSAKVVGPAIAGVLIASASLVWAFGLNAASYVVLVALFLRMNRTQFEPTAVTERERGQVRAGFRYAWDNRDMRLPLFVVLFAGSLLFNYHVILPFFATRDLGGTVSTFALLLSFMGVGSIFGALSVARRQTFTVQYLGWSAVGMAATSLVLALVQSVAMAAVVIVVVGAASVQFVTAAQAFIQLEASPAMRGRMISLLTTVFLLTTPIGALILGWSVEKVGSRATLVLGALATAAVSLGVLYIARVKRPDPVIETDTTRRATLWEL